MFGLRMGVLSRVLREQVAHGTGRCLRCRRLLDTGSALRCSSSAKPKDEIRGNDRGRIELIEVLEIRAQQLQADEGLPLLETETKKLSVQQEEEERTKQKVKTAQAPRGWMEKLQKERILKIHRQKNVNTLKTNKLSVRTDDSQPQENVTKIQKKAATKTKDVTHSSKPVKDTVKTDQDEISCEDMKMTYKGREILVEDKDGNRYGDIQQNIHSYLETCIFLGDLNKAHQCLYYYLQHPARRNRLNVYMFNMLLKAWAKKASLPEIGHIFMLLENAGLKPNIGSYAAALETFGRTESNTKGIKSCLSQMEKDGMSVDQLFQDLIYHEDESQMVLEAIRRVRPDFKPPPRTEIVLDSPLVKDFYKSPSSAYPKMDFTVSELQGWFEEQLKIESRDTITINSVEALKPVSDSKMKARAVLASLRSNWEEALRHALQDSKRQLAEIHMKTRRINMYPYLCLLEDEQYVEIMLQALTRVPPTGESFYIISRDLGMKIYNRFFIRRQLQSDHMDNMRLLYKEYCKLLSKEGKIGLIKPHPIYNQILLDAEETLLTFEASVMPMKCPPIPWVSSQCSPYLLSSAQLMRCGEGAVQHQLLLEKCPPGQLFPVLDSINQLGTSAWRINQPILDIIVSIFNGKGNEKLDIPPPLSEAPSVSVRLTGVLNSYEKFTHQKELARCRKKAAEMFSLRMDALYKLSIANHLRDHIFWFPHNMDFRGRTYPCPPYFNHLGSDVTRALLVFAEGHPLGSRGLDWLKIHLINLTGFKKKSSLQQRKEYADEIMEEILDSADYPMTGRKWWMEADEPWQVLACCMEIAKAIRSPDPAKYVSYFPVHQDGSCNGLQHYAALGRDEIGAKSVNLMPCNIPQDVYSEVALQVEEFRKRDAMKGVKIAQILEGFIGRKVVKQTVMTVVYGVTRYGGRLQIEKRLRETDSFPQEYVWSASHYLVQQVFSSLKEMFSGTREIQHWLTECARMISKSGNTVEWITPLGLPIIQPYHRSKIVALKSNLQLITVKNKNDVIEKPDTMKQKNAFPPNFIHSLDSTHMMLTSLHCSALGLTFVSVHDCFWTHADTVDVMNKVCREQFVSLHSQPILEDLSNHLLQKFCSSSQSMSPDHLKMKTHFSLIPPTGTFNLQNVKDSPYFFS
ncbi:DNA-directed RNA polymerase, mitochondrial isoform 2-T2 [Mantella aurantiaca]